MDLPKVVYEDGDLLVINKPAGLLVHRTRIFNDQFSNFQKEETLVNWLLENYPEVKGVGDPSTNSGQVDLRPGIVHRLDRDTSGVMVVAKNQATFEYLKSLFQERKIIKKYIALVYGLIEKREGIIDQPIGIKSGTIKRTTFSSKMEKKAITEYKMMAGYRLQVKGFSNKKSFQDFSSLNVFPKTGRTHQIRVHLALIGHPVVGDKIYAKTKIGIFNPGRLMLHAESLEFTKINGERIKVEAEEPEDFKRVIKSLAMI